MTSKTAGSEELVYHYTTQVGFKGIIESRCIWATNVAFLNDYSEFQHGTQVIREEVAQLQIPPEVLISTGIAPTEVAVKLAQGIISGNVQMHLKDYKPLAYVTSFFETPAVVSESSTVEADPGDNLSQWRAYSHNGPGFSIGFRKNMLDEIVTPYLPAHPDVWTVTGSCIYQQKDKTSAVRKIVDALAPAFKFLLRPEMQEFFLSTSGEFVAKPPSEARIAQLVDAAFDKLHKNSEFRSQYPEYDEVFRNFVGELMVRPALMKHSAFEAEHEWRIVRFSTQPTKTEFRMGPVGLVPYVRIPLGETDGTILKRLISRVVLGPNVAFSSADKERVLLSTKLFLEKNGLEVQRPGMEGGSLVELSTIPYRS
jgi:hypothetical protein